jgi:signal transduction histidine kinase
MRRVADVVHDLNNPLSYVQLNAEMLVEELRALAEGTAAQPDLDEMVDLMEDIRDGARRMHGILATTDLRDDRDP